MEANHMGQWKNYNKIILYYITSGRNKEGCF